MRILQDVAVENQAAPSDENSVEILSARKVGAEIVRSVALASEFFHGPQPGRYFRARARVWRAKVATR
jgi:hypothetical protein